MTATDRITEYLQEQESIGEINPYVYELLMTRLPKLEQHFVQCNDMQNAINTELRNLNMEPGYHGYGEFMIPISRQEALESFDSDFPVYLIYPNDAEGLCDSREEIVGGDYHFAYEVQTPQSLIEDEPDKNNMKLVYIASPLRGDYNQNIKNAVEYCKNACETGLMALAPHIIFCQWCNDTIPEQREQGLKLGLSLLSKSEELWVMGANISEGMRGEIAFAKEHGIPTFYVEHPHDKNYYPVSADENRLLSKLDCIDGSTNENYQKQMVVLGHEHLDPAHRSPINQLWIATHGPGCPSNYVHSDTVHLTHPVDKDRMAVGRGEILGIVKPEVFSQMAELYPQLNPTPTETKEQDEELCQ